MISGGAGVGGALQIGEILLEGAALHIHGNGQGLQIGILDALGADDGDGGGNGLLVELGKKRGIIVLTDSDDAGFRIRNYVNKLAQGICVKNAYVPAIAGKERRKAQPSKEGVLGVEGVPSEAILRALQTAGAREKAKRAGRAITYTDLYELGLSGTEGSAGVRRAWLQSLGLPPRLSKKALCEVLNSLYTYEEFVQTVPGNSASLI